RYQPAITPQDPRRGQWGPAPPRSSVPPAEKSCLTIDLRPARLSWNSGRVERRTPRERGGVTEECPLPGDAGADGRLGRSGRMRAGSRRPEGCHRYLVEERVLRNVGLRETELREGERRCDQKAGESQASRAVSASVA